MPRMLPRSRSKHSCPWTRDFRQRQSNTPPPAKPVVRQSCDQWRQHVGKTPGTVRPAAKTVRDAAKQENLEPQMHTDAHRWAGVRRVRSQPEPYNRTGAAVPMRWSLSHRCASVCICGSKFLACFLACRTPPQESPITTRKQKPMHQNCPPSPGARGFKRRQNPLHQFARRLGARRRDAGWPGSAGKSPCTNSLNPGAAGAAAGERPMRDQQQGPLAPIHAAVSARQGSRGRQNPIHLNSYPNGAADRLARSEMRRW